MNHLSMYLYPIFCISISNNVGQFINVATIFCVTFFILLLLQCSVHPSVRPSVRMCKCVCVYCLICHLMNGIFDALTGYYKYYIISFLFINIHVCRRRQWNCLGSATFAGYHQCSFWSFYCDKNVVRCCLKTTFSLSTIKANYRTNGRFSVDQFAVKNILRTIYCIYG